MPADVIATLSQFTPDAGKLARDEILFAAGRASAPSARPWKWAVLGLALVQVASVAGAVVFWPDREIKSVITQPPVVVPMVQPGGPIETYEPYSYGYLISNWDGSSLPLPGIHSSKNPEPILTIGSGRKQFD